jgi:hypothetical protein
VYFISMAMGTNFIANFDLALVLVIVTAALISKLGGVLLGARRGACLSTAKSGRSRGAEGPWGDRHHPGRRRACDRLSVRLFQAAFEADGSEF